MFSKQIPYWYLFLTKAGFNNFFRQSLGWCAFQKQEAELMNCLVGGWIDELLNSRLD